MNDEFLRNVLSFGDKGKNWLEKIPGIIDSLEKKWGIKILSPYTLSYNYVASVERQDGTRAVVKIGMRWEKEFFNEIEALKVFNGDSTPKLLDEDRENAAILIEEVTPGIPLSMLTDDEESTRILAKIIRKIQRDLPKNNSFITIFDWTRKLREYPKKENPTLPMDIVHKGIQLFEYLLASSKDSVLTHGDLHQDNVLSSDKFEWIAIDPKGIAAEPLYDVAALIRGPYKKTKAISDMDLDSLLKRRIEILSEELQSDEKRIHMWCLAQTILSRVWTEDSKEYADFGMKIIASLIRIQDDF